MIVKTSAGTQPRSSSIFPADGQVLSFMKKQHREEDFVELTADALVLHRVQGRKVFRYADIADAGLWTGKPSSLFRFCGSGAFYGFIGWFSGGGLGTHFEYVGCYGDAFYIRLRSGRTYLLSCDGSAQAVKRLREGMQGKAA